jgi:hypothetical protein
VRNPVHGGAHNLSVGNISTYYFHSILRLRMAVVTQRSDREIVAIIAA